MTSLALIALLAVADGGATDGGATDGAAPPLAAPPPPLEPLQPSLFSPRASSPPAPLTVRPLPEVWPLQYVLRPQTLPAGTTRLLVSGFLFLPDEDYATVGVLDGPPFHNSFALGIGVQVGVTSWLELQAHLPRLICLADRAPSACSDANAFNGSRLALNFAVVRRRALQLMLGSSVGVGLTVPMSFAWQLSGRLKWLVSEQVALELGLDGTRWVSTPESFPDRPVAGVGADGEIHVQVTPNLAIHVGLRPLVPFGPGQPSLRFQSGASWTFKSGTQLGLIGGTYNLLPRYSFDPGVPGWFAGTALTFWL